MITEYAEQEARQLDAMKSKVQALIAELPDNENINRVSRNAFTIKFSELSKHDNWLPKFHDFKAQYELVLDRLDKSKSMAQFQTFLEKAIETKSIKTGKHVDKLHPDVVEQLKSLI